MDMLVPCGTVPWMSRMYTRSWFHVLTEYSWMEREGGWERGRGEEGEGEG